MSVQVLVTGSIFREPQERNSASGRSYTSTTVKAAGADNEGSDFWSVLAFGDTAKSELLRLHVGDKVSLQGKPKFEIFEKDGKARISRTVFADQVLALRAAPREKKPKAPESERPPLERADVAPTRSPDLDDDIPF
jgi:single-stranded DNA-binding protein